MARSEQVSSAENVPLLVAPTERGGNGIGVPVLTRSGHAGAAIELAIPGLEVHHQGPHRAPSAMRACAKAIALQLL